MVKNAATLGRSGLHDFLLVRFSAVILALYALYLLIFFICHDVTYDVWHQFFSLVSTRAFTLMALVAMLVHAWIGLWQVASDYLKHSYVRLIVLWVVNFVAIFYVAAGIAILWGD